MERIQARIVDVPLDAIYDEHANKGEFIEMDESFLKNMFKDLVLEEGYELGNEFNLGEIYGADYYEERNPGFPDEWYEILADEDKRLNKEYKDTELLLVSNASAEDQQSIEADTGEPPVDCEECPEAHGDIKAIEQAVEPVVCDKEGVPEDID
jgi:hypothetical protein